LAWKDAIHAGMARRSSLLKTYEKRVGEQKASLEDESKSTWCFNEVFGTGSFIPSEVEILHSLVDEFPGLSGILISFVSLPPGKNPFAPLLHSWSPGFFYKKIKCRLYSETPGINPIKI